MGLFTTIALGAMAVAAVGTSINNYNEAKHARKRAKAQQAEAKAAVAAEKQAKADALMKKINQSRSSVGIAGNVFTSPSGLTTPVKTDKKQLLGE